MRINVYLDDLRTCPEGFHLARTYEEVVELLKNKEIDILSLDHDLGIDENGDLLKSGYDVAKYICENDCDINKIYVHSDNIVGKTNIIEIIKASMRRGFITKDIKLYSYPLYPNRYE